MNKTRLVIAQKGGGHLRNTLLTWEQDWQWRKRREEGCRKGRNGKEEKPQHGKKEGKEK